MYIRYIRTVIGRDLPLIQRLTLSHSRWGEEHGQVIPTQSERCPSTLDSSRREAEWQTLADKAVATEGSLSFVSPIISPLPLLHKAFAQYIAAAEGYSHLLSFSQISDAEKAAIKKKWRLLLERAEKVKRRIETLGDQAGKAAVNDAIQEEGIFRRSGRINGCECEVWVEPNQADFEPGDEPYKETSWMDRTIGGHDVDFVRAAPEAWENEWGPIARWMAVQGIGEDCSIAAVLGACLEHNRRHGSTVSVT